MKFKSTPCYTLLTMLLLLARPKSLIYVLVFVLRFCSASQPFCNLGIYGVPNYRDCVSAWRSIPFALKPTDDYDSKRFELWSEPQYLHPPFTAVRNRYKPLPINQLPKIWRYGTLLRLFPARKHTPKPLVGHRCCHPLTNSFSDTCRLALMSYGRRDGSIANALWGASWRAILDQMQILFACGSPRTGSTPTGGYIPFICAWYPFSSLHVLHPS